MTDYLEEYLGNAEALLEQIRQLEQSVSGLHNQTVSEENVGKSYNIDSKMGDIEVKSEIVSEKDIEVYNTRGEVNQLKKEADNLSIDLEIHEKEQDTHVNHLISEADNNRNPGQIETISGGKRTQTNTQRAESRSPLSVQLEELDRAVSALTTLTAEGRKAAQGSYPISLSPPQGPATGPNIAGMPGGDWSGAGPAAGADFAYGGTQSWAEQTDRMFRRDSRRYDGGFYLY